ncbi:hypothetical protein [Kitasatospora sp. NPDC057223]
MLQGEEFASDLVGVEDVAVEAVGGGDGGAFGQQPSGRSAGDPLDG